MADTVEAEYIITKPMSVRASTSNKTAIRGPAISAGRTVCAAFRAIGLAYAPVRARRALTRPIKVFSCVILNHNIYCP